MKNIGIIVADPNEIVKYPWELMATKKINQFSFSLFKPNIILVHSGIGIANAAAATQVLISNFELQEIWNYGAVGGNEPVKLYDLVTPEHIYYHDVFTPWYPQGQTPREKPYWTNNITSHKSYNLASGSSFIDSAHLMAEITKNINCYIFDMETAAIAQIAHKNKIPLKVIKCVSDVMGASDHVDQLESINERIKKAGQKAFDYLLKELKV